MDKNSRALVKRSLTRIDQLERELAAERNQHQEPLAVIGLGCRFPGGATPEQYWQSLDEGRDLVCEIPESRLGLSGDWPEGLPRWAGLLDGEQDGFDPAFFGIAPDEAVSLDPQQRLLLEVGWEVFENAGIIPATLQGSRTGVFVGMTSVDYQQRVYQRPSRAFKLYDLTGNMLATASGRLSYTWGLQGPSITLDTACSSSLVAIHCAGQSLRSGESDLALAGGVNLILSEHSMIALHSTHAMSPDGRCKTFDATANGIVRGEGCGLVLLKRLADAERDGDTILAKVRGSAINQDGASSGLTVPNVLSQQALLKQALRNAQINPQQVGYIECHGTGTPVGDPIETDALKAVFGQPRDDHSTLKLGAVKTNMGHLEAAAGVAGFIKVVLAIQHRQLPANLHFRHLNPRLKLAGTPIEPLADAVAWQAIDGTRIAAVSSFGISGTNVHMLLQQAADSTVDSAQQASITESLPAALPNYPIPLLLSAKSANALRLQGQQLATYLQEHPALASGDLATALLHTRTEFDHRALVLARDGDDLQIALQSLAAGEPHSAVLSGQAKTRGKLVFVFPGQGSQWPLMARDLLQSSRVFRNKMAQCETALQACTDWSLSDVLNERPGAPELERIDVIQGVLFAVMVSLAELWREAGIEPDAVIGQSQGEVAAACVAGALSLEDAAKVIALRSQIVARKAPPGTMALIELSVDEVIPYLSRWQGALEVAGVNGPHTTVISGDIAAVDELLLLCERETVFARKIRADYSSHNRHMEILQDDMLAVLQVNPQRAQIPIYSTVTDTVLTGEEMNADYWYDNIRQPVQFYSATRRAMQAGHSFFVEISPHTMLSTVLDSIFEVSDTPAAMVGTLRRDKGDQYQFMRSLAALHTQGYPVDWQRFIATGSAPFVSLPNYAFDRQRFWIESAEQKTVARSSAPGEGQFWQAVEQRQADKLAEVLGVEDKQARRSIDTILPALADWRQQQSQLGCLNSWRYQVRWQPLSGTAEAGPAVSGGWLLLVPESLQQSSLQPPWAELISALEDQLLELGQVLKTVVLKREDLDADAIQARMQETLGCDQPGQYLGVISLLALDESWLKACVGVTRGLATTVGLLQALSAMDIGAALWMLTQGAVSIGRSDNLSHPLQAAVWGLGRVVALEQPERGGGLIDLPDFTAGKSSLTALIERLLSVISTPGHEDQFALRASAAFLPRLERIEADKALSAQWCTSGTALITGGTGAIGLSMARWLASKGAKHLLLASRSGAAAQGVEALKTELEPMGTGVTVVACDLGDYDAVDVLLKQHQASTLPPLRCVVHAAGVGAALALADVSLAELADAIKAKVVGAWHLHRAFADCELDGFILFSSGAGVWGGRQQGPYAAGNAYLNALAEHRRGLGMVATSIAWGLWGYEGGDNEGMSASIEARQRFLSTGFSPMPTALALQVLHKALDDNICCMAVADIDWSVFAPLYGAARERPLLLAIPEARAALEQMNTATDNHQGVEDLLSTLLPLTESERLKYLIAMVQAETASVLGHTDVHNVDASMGFFDIGLDSLMALQLRKRLHQHTGLKLPSTLAFDHPSADRVACYIRERLAAELGQATMPTMPPANNQTAQGGLSKESIAIVGIGLRLPGKTEGIDDLWRLLEREEDAIGPVLEGRWQLDDLYDPDPEAKGKTYVKEAGFIEGIDQFDADFFGLSPREARFIDPQHRLLLESGWHALENAGIVADALRDSSTGVFIGIGPSDYEQLQVKVEEAEAYGVMGTHSSFAAGRLAFALGVQGPAMSIDTACSSSLVALHQACRALRQRECSLALVGGVQIMAVPETFVALSRLRALAADGRSKTFSANADGYGRGEGVVVCVVERLSDALANKRRILGLVRGSAVNHDGASSGITAPNGNAQRKVIQAALLDAGLSPEDVDAVECHGTGTILGDPIEVAALAQIYGEGRDPEKPLNIGTIKSTIGHLESASGLAGVASIIASLRHEALPTSLHSQPLNPHIDWQQFAVAVTTQLQPWRHSAKRRRRAGVSSFGLSGTNAHVIIEEPPELSGKGAGALQLPFYPVPLAARNAAALYAQQVQLQHFLVQEPAVEVRDIAATLAVQRAHFDSRSTLLASDRAGLLDALQAAIAGDKHPAVISAEKNSAEKNASTERGGLAFLFTGQGSQYPGMGQDLYATFPVYRQAFDECCGWFDTQLEVALREVMWASEEDEQAKLLDQTAYTQPALFTFAVSAFRLLQHWGLQPDWLLGHSIGELAAAHVSGVLSLENACTLVAARARLMQALPGGGKMASLPISEEQTLALLEGFADSVSIASINSPAATVISGDESAVNKVVARMKLAHRGRRSTTLSVSHAFHSAHMDSMLDAFREIAEGIEFQPPGIPVIANVSGQRASTEELCSADYWVQQVRAAVRFSQGVETLVEKGVTRFMEVGPAPVLVTLAQQSFTVRQSPYKHPPAPVFASVSQKQQPAVDSLLKALAAVYVGGQSIDWKAFYEPLDCNYIEMPGYPFQRRRHWTQASSSAGAPGGVLVRCGEYPLSGERISLPDGQNVHIVQVGPGVQSYLADHKAYQRMVMPGAFYISTLLAVAASYWPDEPIALCDIEFVRGLFFERNDERVALHLQLSPLAESEGYSVVLATQQNSEWVIHSTAVIRPASPDEWVGQVMPLADLQRLETALDTDMSHADQLLNSMNIDWGPQWWWLDGAKQSRPDTGFGGFSAPEGMVRDAPIPPGLLDNAFALAMWGMSMLGRNDERLEEDGVTPRLPFSLQKMLWNGAAAIPCWGEHEILDIDRDAVGTTMSQLHLWDEQGETVATIEGFAVRRAPAERFLSAAALPLYTIGWRDERSKVSRQPVTNTSCVVLGEDAALSGGLLNETFAAMQRYPDIATLRQQLDKGDELPAAVLLPLVSPVTVSSVAVSPASGNMNEHGAAIYSLTRRALALAQSWLEDPRLSRSKLVFITRGAIAASDDEVVDDVAGAALWGLLRSFQSEHPECEIMLVDVDADKASLEALAELWCRDGLQFVLRAGQPRSPAISLLPEAKEATGSSADPATLFSGKVFSGKVFSGKVFNGKVFNATGTVLITGGTGAIANVLTRYLVDHHGVRHLLLLSRRGPAAPGADKLLIDLQSLGAEVDIIACDVRDYDKLSSVIANIHPEHPLTTVIHAAGVIEDAAISALSIDQLAAVISPKVEGALNLHALTRDLDSVTTLYFSSLSGVLGNVGQANYAAANLALDALSSVRNALGLKTVSLAWGPWADLGMIGELSDVDLASMRRMGIVPFKPEQGLALFDAALSRAQGYVLAAYFDRTAMAENGGQIPAMLQALVPEASRKAALRGVSAFASLRGRLATETSAEERVSQLSRFVRSQVAPVLGITDPMLLDEDRPLQELGLDSMMAVEVRGLLKTATGVAFPTTLLFDHPTVSSLAELLAETAIASISPEMDSKDIILDEQLSDIDNDEALFELIDKSLASSGEYQ